jgi:peptidoglycan/xylan/chitin deacetylase (PgdA/CDA1 family)
MLGAITAAIATAAAATFAGVHSMVPTSQLYGASFVGIAPGSRKLALTYDDGPNDAATEPLLDVLLRHQVKATFFMLGRYVAERPAIARRIAAEAHVIGNHTFDHPNLIFVTNAELRRQIERTQRAIHDATGVLPNLFRPGFGGRRPGTFAVAQSYGLTPVMWRVICNDWKATSSEFIERRAERAIRGGEVILLHDGDHLRMGADRSHTVKATDNLIRRYKDLGYEFVTVPEMMKA